MKYLVFKDTSRIFEDFVNLDCQLQCLIMDKTSFTGPLPICKSQYILKFFFDVHKKKILKHTVMILSGFEQ